MTEPKYTLNDCGCYVDSARGCHAIEAIVKFAEAHGMPQSSLADINEWPDEVEDSCDHYMNERFPVDGATWGRSEQSDWGLWTIEDPDTAGRY